MEELPAEDHSSFIQKNWYRSQNQKETNQPALHQSLEIFGISLLLLTCLNLTLVILRLDLEKSDGLIYEFRKCDGRLRCDRFDVTLEYKKVACLEDVVRGECGGRQYRLPLC